MGSLLLAEHMAEGKHRFRLPCSAASLFHYSETRTYIYSNLYSTACTTIKHFDCTNLASQNDRFCQSTIGRLFYIVYAAEKKLMIVLRWNKLHLDPLLLSQSDTFLSLFFPPLYGAPQPSLHGITHIGGGRERGVELERGSGQRKEKYPRDLKGKGWRRERAKQNKKNRGRSRNAEDKCQSGGFPTGD